MQKRVVFAFGVTGLLAVVLGWAAFPAVVRVPAGVLFQGGEQIGLWPAGEITRGFEIRQSIRLADAAIERGQRLQGSVRALCVNVLLANFGNRANWGAIRVSLEQEGLRLETDIHAASVQDNAVRAVCFPVEEFHGFTGPELELKITGLDGQPGTSITAWLTQDTQRGEAYINGAASEGALVFDLSYRAGQAQISYPALALYLTYVIAFCFLLFLIVVR